MARRHVLHKRLRLDLRRPVAGWVERLYPEIRLQAAIDTGLDRIQQMRAHPAGYALLLDIFEGLAQQVDLAFLDGVVGQTALDVHRVRAAVNRTFDAFLDGLSRGAVGNPLNLAAPLVPVTIDDAVGNGIGQDRIDSVVLGQLQRLEDLLVGMIGLDQRGDVHQVPAVRPAADQVAAAEYPAYLEVLDLAEGQLIAGRGGFVLCRLGPAAGALRHPGQQVLFFKTSEPQCNSRRSRNGFLQKPATIHAAGRFRVMATSSDATRTVFHDKLLRSGTLGDGSSSPA